MAVTNDLSADRRVLRHAATLRDEGYGVLTIGRDDLGVRSRRGWRFYAEYNWRLWRRLLHTECDVIWANDTDTLPGAFMAARMKRRKLVMDAHELFPEVPEIQHKPLVRWVWRTIERCLMPQCDAMLTVCQSLADYYKEKYGVEMTVVRNISLTPKSLTPQPPLPEGEGRTGEATLLYQGCVNLGRGVDWAIDALEWLPGCRLMVAGRGDLLDAMKAYAAQKPWADRVTFLGHVPPDQLGELTLSCGVRSAGSRSAQAVGLVMLEDMGLSYHYALPNRIGDFVAAGVPMVVSDLPEMAAVVRRFGVGEVIGKSKMENGKMKEENGKMKEEREKWKMENGKMLAEAVKKVLAREWKDEDFAEARKDMDWNKEKIKLLEVASRAVRG